MDSIHTVRAVCNWSDSYGSDTCSVFEIAKGSSNTKPSNEFQTPVDGALQASRDDLIEKLKQMHDSIE